MYFTKLTVLMISACFSQGLYAKCDVKSKEIFSCFTEKKKLIEICDATKTINYFMAKLVNLRFQLKYKELMPQRFNGLVLAGG